MPGPAEPVRVSDDSDALASLEERILRAVELVTQLRQQKEAAEARAQTLAADQSAASRSLEELEAENTSLKEELEVLREERKHVRTRIEKLLGQMDSLAG
jgi:FtsZ-binding cell division protein ZapB